MTQASRSNSWTVFFHYDGASAHVLAEMDAAGATLTSYAYNEAGRVTGLEGVAQACGVAWAGMQATLLIEQ